MLDKITGLGRNYGSLNIATINIHRKQSQLLALPVEVALNHVIVHQNATVWAIGHMDHSIFDEPTDINAFTHIFDRHIRYILIVRTRVVAKEFRERMFSLLSVDLSSLITNDHFFPVTTSDAGIQTFNPNAGFRELIKVVFRQFNFIWK